MQKSLKNNWNIYTLEESKFVSALPRDKLAEFILPVYQIGENQCCSLKGVEQKYGFEN